MATVLHTSDWHVGKGLGRCDRTTDHRAALEEVVAVAREAKPDLILHTGDVFDGPRPAHEHARLAVTALRELAAVAPTLVLAGNHDSQVQFGVFSTLLGDHDRLRFIARARRPDQGGIVEIETAAGERIRVAPLPFVHANRQVDWFGDPQRFMGEYAHKLRLINNLLTTGLAAGYDGTRDVLVYAAHLYVGGAIKAGSERAVHVTEDYAIERTALPGVSYVALGHIHRPQALPGTPVSHYAGSPICMDFGEAGERKSVVLVEASPGSAARAQVLPLSAGRALRELRGSLEEIARLSNGVGEAIVRVVVDCEHSIENLQAQVRDLLPRADIVEIVENVRSRRLEVLDPDQEIEDEHLGYDELLEGYLTSKGTRAASAAQVQQLFAAMRTERGEDDHHPPIEGLAELLGAPLPDAPVEDEQLPEERKALT